MSTPPKLPPLPSQDQPIVQANGLVNPVWYQWLKIVEAKVKVL